MLLGVDQVEDLPDNASALTLKVKASQTLLDIAPIKAIIKDLQFFDANNDGIINIDDCPYDHGSPDAIHWWRNVQQMYMKATKSLPEAEEFDTTYGRKFHGFYNGEPVVDGHYEKGFATKEYIVDKMMVTHGYSKAVTLNVVGFVARNLYGGGP